MAANYRIKIVQGETYKQQFTYKDDQVTPQPIDITGYTGVGTVRKTTADPRAYPIDITFNIPQTDGVFYLNMPHEVAANIPVAATDPTKYDIYVYDVFLIDSAGNRSKILYGEAWVYPSATKG